MATSLLMWNKPSSSSSSMENNNNGGGGGGGGGGSKESATVLEDQLMVDQTVEVIKAQQHDQSVRQRGRSKSGKVAAQKRPPQRGLGVAQLERLRLQERWKKMTEIDSQARLHYHHHQQQQVHGNPQFQFQFPFPISEHNGGGSSSVIHQYSKFAPAKNYGSSSSIMSDGGVVFQPCAEVVVGGMREADRVPIAAGELSSSQKVHGVFDRTRGFHGENLGFNEGIRAHHQYIDNQNMVSVESCDLLRLNLGQNNSISTIVDGSSRGNLWRASYSSSPNAKEEVEVVAVHRRGNPMGSASVLMEYEFFPCRNTNNSYPSSNSNKQYHSSSSIAEAHQTADQSMSSTEPSPSNTNWIDLSLRLSC